MKKSDNYLDNYEVNLTMKIRIVIIYFNNKFKEARCK